MEYQLKHISPDAIAEAIAKAELYRSLNEPEEAESICRDILAIESRHQLALRLLGLALTDQFTGGGSDRYRETEQIFEQNFNRIRNAVELGETRAFKRGEAENAVRPAAGRECSGGSEGVLAGHGYPYFSVRGDSTDE